MWNAAQVRTTTAEHEAMHIVAHDMGNSTISSFKRQVVDRGHGCGAVVQDFGGLRGAWRPPISVENGMDHRVPAALNHSDHSFPDTGQTRSTSSLILL